MPLLRGFCGLGLRLGGFLLPCRRPLFLVESFAFGPPWLALFVRTFWPLLPPFSKTALASLRFFHSLLSRPPLPWWTAFNGLLVGAVGALPRPVPPALRLRPPTAPRVRARAQASGGRPLSFSKCGESRCFRTMNAGVSVDVLILSWHVERVLSNNGLFLSPRTSHGIGHPDVAFVIYCGAAGGPNKAAVRLPEK